VLDRAKLRKLADSLKSHLKILRRQLRVENKAKTVHLCLVRPEDKSVGAYGPVYNSFDLVYSQIITTSPTPLSEIPPPGS
jgi:hypothetical protein